MPSIDVSGLDFLKLVAVIVVSVSLKVASDLILENSKRRRMASDMDTIERLSSLDLTRGEREILEAYRARVISELPSKKAEGYRITPSDAVIMVWLALAAIMVFAGGTWLTLIALCSIMLIVFLTAKIGYEAGIAEGVSRERENIISAKRLEHDCPKQVHDRE